MVREYVRAGENTWQSQNFSDSLFVRGSLYAGNICDASTVGGAACVRRI